MTPKWAKISVEVMCMYVNHEPKLIQAFELLLAREPITKLQRKLLVSYVTRETVFDTLDLQEFDEVLDKLEIVE